jgi:hypothetical protein
VVSKILHPTKSLYNPSSFERVEPPESGIQESSTSRRARSMKG